MKMFFRGRILTVPNLLTLMRILLIPLFMWFYLSREDVTATAIVLAVSGVTDVMDGFIARRFHMVSDLGKALDPMADKLTQLAVLCCLVVQFPRMLWLIILLCVKEILVGSIVLATIHKTEVVESADWHGKATTVLLYTVMLLHLSWLDMPDQLSWTLIALCMGMIIFSGILYGVRNIRRMRGAGTNGEKNA